MKILAVASSNKELSALESHAAQNLIVIQESIYLNLEPGKPGTIVKMPEDFLSEKEVRQLEKEAAFFARNWYKFDPEFEKECTFDGISLGFVYENEMFRFFKNTLVLLKGLRNAIAGEKPDLVLANRNSFSGEAVEAVATAKGNRIKLLDLAEEKRFLRFPNFSRKKLREARKALPKAISQGFFSAEKKALPKAFSARRCGEKTVFIRSRGYLGKLEQALRGQPELDVVSLDEFLLAKMLNPINAYRYVSTRSGSKKVFREMFNRLLAKKGFREKMAFEGIAFDKMVAGRTRQAAERDWPEFIFLIEMLSRLFYSRKPKAVVVWEDSVPFGRICTLLAKRIGAKSLMVQHGEFKAVAEGDWIRAYAPLTADKIAVFGDLFRKELLGHKVPDEKIVVTGGPAFDALQMKNSDAARFKESLGLKGKGMLVLATQPCFGKADLKEAIESMLSYAEEADKALVVRPHPLEKAEWYQSILQGRGIVLQQARLHDLFNAADAIVMQASTVGLDAMALGKPLILFGKQPLDSIFRETDAIPVAKGGKELRQALEAAGADKALGKKRRSFVSDAMFRLDGKATERVVALVKEMAS